MNRILLLLTAVWLAGCATSSPRPSGPVPLAEQVDLPRFMGDWYIIAHIPTSLDHDVYDAVESYRLEADGSIATTYTNRQGGFDGEPKRLTPTMHVVPGTGNAQWDVVFAWWWPFRYEYRVAHLEPDYSAAIIARSERDYLWIFSRTPTMSARRLARYEKLVASWGYDASRLERVPQRNNKK